MALLAGHRVALEGSFHYFAANLGRVGPSPRDEVLRLDIAMKQVVLVNESHPVDHLVSQQTHCLNTELAATLIE